MEVRILHIEDSPADDWLLQGTLREAGWAVEVKVITPILELFQLIEMPRDVVLCDFGLPFVVVSGQIGEENAVALMKAGADDYVSKNYPQRLSPIEVRDEGAGVAPALISKIFDPFFYDKARRDRNRLGPSARGCGRAAPPRTNRRRASVALRDNLLSSPFAGP